MPAETPPTWTAALMTLIAARVSLIQIESQTAKQTLVKTLVCAIAAITAGLFTWALALTATIAWLSQSQNWSWPVVTFAAAAIHLLAVLVFARIAKPNALPSFPVTRAEFQKDREWIENLPKTKPSQN